VILAAGWCIVSGPAIAAERPAELQRIVKSAQAEGKLQIVSALFGVADGVSVAEAGLKKMFGVDISIEFAPGPAMVVQAAKLDQEFQAGEKASTDVFAATAVQLGPYRETALFRKVPWPELMPDRISPKLVEGHGIALRFETGVPGILYNTKLASWVKDIKVMADLLKPEYRGKFVTTPYLAGFDALLAKDQWGAQKTVDYIRKFSTQVSGFMNCASEARIASGEVPAFALDCTGGAPNRPRYKSVLELQIVGDAAQRRYYYVSIPAHAPHPNAAILYSLYLLSPEGQRDLALSLDGCDLDDLAESVVRQRVKALEDQQVKFITIDFDWWERNSADIKEPMQDIVRIMAQNR
jgi:iron(III) transport system substrate-binding protein